MEPAKVIARMTATTQDPERVGVSSVPGLDGMDASRALAGLERGPYLLARVKYANELSSLPDLETELWHEMVKLASARGWRRYGDGLPRELLRKMATLAVFEVLHPPRCGRCEGRKWVYPKGGVPKECPVCGGEGKQRISGNTRAKAVDLSKACWSTRWANRYGEFIGLLQHWDSLVKRHVKKKMRFDEKTQILG